MSTDLQISSDSIDQLFSNATGIALDQIAASDGADPLDIVNCAQANGWDIGLQTALVPDFATSDLSRNSICLGIARAGAVMAAVTLYPEDMDDFNDGASWLKPPSGDPVGGHMICLAAYSPSGPQIATWGQWQPASWEWLAARLELVVLTGWRQLLGPGFDYPSMWAAESNSAVAS